MNIDEEYPRPQFVRKNWLNLNGSWDFCFDDENVGEKKEFFKYFPIGKQILVPFTYETKLSGINDQSIHENVWYSKTVKLQKTDRRIILNFEASDFVTKIWINGRYVGMNVGGYHRFSFDVTGYIIDGSNNFAIKIEDSLSKSQPRGKQRYKEESWKCWYVQTTGIWGTVWLEEVSDVRLISVKITPNYDEKEVNILVGSNVGDKDKEYELETAVLFEEKVVASSKTKIEDESFECKLDLGRDVKYWSLDQPNLYVVKFRLYENGELSDEVSSYFGVRKISINKNELLLNNKELYLRMVLDQGYWPDSGLTPPNEEAIKQDISIVKRYGFNGIRKHQKIEDERFLYYCDKNGILVWSEMANCYEYDNLSKKYFTDEWQKILERNYNHPCIIAWVPFNESWGIPNVSTDVDEQKFTEEIYKITKSYDGTRPVICNDGWQHTIADIVTIHDYTQDGNLLFGRYNVNDDVLSNKVPFNGDRKLFSSGYGYKGQPIVMSEYGGIALNSQDGWGYGKQVKDENEFTERFSDLTNAIKNTKDICGYCYTQLTDVQQEVNGLVDENRKPKFSEKIIKRIKEINSGLS